MISFNFPKYSYLWLWQHNWIHFGLLIHDLGRFLHWILEHVAFTDNNFDLVLSTCGGWLFKSWLQVCNVKIKSNSRFFWHFAICKIKLHDKIFNVFPKVPQFIQIDSSYFALAFYFNWRCYLCLLFVCKSIFICKVKLDTFKEHSH